MISKSLLSTGASLIAMSTFATTAYGQTVSPDNDEPPATTQNKTLDEIVVTAQKRSENLQQVPVSVTAFSTETLDKSRVVDLQGIASRTPGFAIGEFNVGQPQLFIRGIGSNEDGAATDSSVVVFMDGVYVGRAAGAALDVYDLARIEVLRGPQGTLYGKNVIGGAINVVSNKPSEETRGSVEASYGNLDAVRLRGFVSGALSDKVFAKISGQYSARDGYVRSVFPGNDTDYQNRDDLSFRGQLRFVPTDNLDILLSADFARKRINGPGHIAIGGTIGAGNDAVDLAASRDIYTTFADIPGYQDRDVQGYSATVDLDLGGATLTSITAYRSTEYSFLDDVFGSNLDAFGVFDLHDGADEEADQFTQELRLSSNNEGPLSWIVGAYYLNEDIERTETFFVISPLAGLNGNEVWDQFNVTDSYSVFADLTYEITDRLSLTAGARYTNESKDVRLIGTNGSGFASVSEDYDVSPSENFEEITPRFVLDFQATDDVLLYASATNGFKSGGFSGQNPTAASAELAFDPETAWAYEVGTKSRFFDNRLQLNLAAFYTDYKDLQILLQRDPNAIGLTTINASDAVTKGIEAEFIAQLGNNLQLSGSYAYLDTEYQNFLDPATGDDLSGNPLRNAPENSFNAAATYTRDISDSIELVAHYEHRYQSLTFQDIRVQPEGGIPAHDIANAQIALNFDNGTSVSVWADNLWDEEYFIHNFPFLPSVAGDAIPGAPKTYGMTVGYKF